jgi:hypothetical protein
MLDIKMWLRLVDAVNSRHGEAPLGPVEGNGNEIPSVGKDLYGQRMQINELYCHEINRGGLSRAISISILLTRLDSGP